jgi:hypothetical protein
MLLTGYNVCSLPRQIPSSRFSSTQLPLCLCFAMITSSFLPVRPSHSLPPLRRSLYDPPCYIALRMARADVTDGLPELSAKTTSRLSNALATFVSADDGPGGEALGTVEPKAV